MYGSIRRLPVFVAPVLGAIAIAGFLAGHHGAKAAPTERARLAYGSSIVLEYPSTWRPARAVAQIPGLAIARPLLLAPGGDAARAGLLSGQLPGGEPGPLPGRFLTGMRELPRTEIVELLGVQAYRYNHLRLPAYERALELYVIPNPAGAPTALACYAAKDDSSYLAQCEQIVARLTLIGQSRYDLNPDPDYSSRLGRLIGALDSERLTLRRRMRPAQAPVALAAQATSLAGRFATAAASMRVLQTPSAAGPAQAALVGSIEHARASYGLLASAAQADSPSEIVAAQRQVDTAEAAVDGALETFALLGYSRP